jgi:hypothetical protein
VCGGIGPVQGGRRARARGALTGKGLGGGVLSRREADFVRI